MYNTTTFHWQISPVFGSVFYGGKVCLLNHYNINYSTSLYVSDSCWKLLILGLVRVIFQFWKIKYHKHLVCFLHLVIPNGVGWISSILGWANFVIKEDATASSASKLERYTSLPQFKSPKVRSNTFAELSTAIRIDTFKNYLSYKN